MTAERKDSYVVPVAGLAGDFRAGLKAAQVAEDCGEPSPSHEYESAAIGALLTRSALRRPSSVELGWKNFAVERRTTMPVEKPERILDHHFLILWDAHVAEGEIAERSGRGDHRVSNWVVRTSA